MADAIHLLTQYVINLRQGMSREQAMEQSLATNLGPIFLTSVTTAVGFLGMNFADSTALGNTGTSESRINAAKQNPRSRGLPDPA